MTIRIFYARRIFYEIQKICKNAIFGVFFALRHDFVDILQNTYPKHIKIFFGKDYDFLRSGKKNLGSPAEYSTPLDSPTGHIASGRIQHFGNFCGF